MPLNELDKEYREMEHFPADDKIKYCEDLIIRMRKRLEDNNPGTIRTLITEMIESAENELQKLIVEKNRVQK
jgi:hypothetical protein